MAITASVLTTVGNFADGNTLPGSETPGTSFATASISPGARKLVLLFIAQGDTSGATTTPSASGAGLTFTHLIGNQQGVGNQRVDIMAAVTGNSPGSGAVTISFGATTVENCGWTVVEVSGAKVSAGGAGAIQQVSNTGNDSGSNVEVSFANAIAAGNATFGVVTGNTESVTYTAGSGFTLLGNGWSCDGPSNKGIVEWGTTRPVAFTNTGTPLCAMAAVEVIAAPVAAAAAVLTGTGDLTASNVARTAVVAATASGTGALAATAQWTANAAATASGSGGLSAAGVRIMDAAASASGAGGLVAAGGVARTAAAVLSGLGDLVAGGIATIAAAASLSGLGDLIASGRRPWERTVKPVEVWDHTDGGPNDED